VFACTHREQEEETSKAPHTDMVFWLIGANAPIMKIYFKYIFKKSKN
jgi:hypothetical protein